MRANTIARASLVMLAIILVLMGVPIASAAAPENDTFAGAKAITLANTPPDSVTITLNTTDAGADADDPPFCTSPLNATVWYSLTPAQNELIDANTFGSNYNAFIIVATGAPGSFNFVACGNSVQFNASSSQTYFFTIGEQQGPYPYPAPGGSLQFTVNSNPLPPPVAQFYYNPSDPSTYDTIQFQDISYDPAGSFIASEEWSFGDGAVASGCCPTHHYASNGNYTVSLTVSTPDGRSASASQQVQVRTHDVAIVKLSAPKTGRQNQTAKISVSLASKLAAETVHVDLYKSDPLYFEGFRLIGYQELLVPARSSNRTVTVNFNYTFTSDDANIGKVTFKAVATIVGGRDALAGDNEARATTKVSR